MRDFTKLDIWKRSHALCLNIYLITKGYPKDELFGLVSQMRRSSSSVPTKIAEGCGRGTDPQTHRFFDYAIGSLTELEYQLILSHDLTYIDKTTYLKLRDETVEIRKMTIAYSKKIKNNQSFS